MRWFCRYFIEANKDWLVQLTQKARQSLRGISKSIVGLNGDDFNTECFFETAFAYTTLQLMRVEARRDELHFDGGASLLHIGLTIFGERLLHCWFSDGDEQVFKQRPGSIYVGNMCAVQHQVEHYGPDAAQELFTPRDASSAEGAASASQEEGAAPASQTEGVLIAVMCRSDVFRHARARKMKGRPTPIDVYNALNGLVADQLAREPLALPCFGSVVHDYPDHEENLAPASTAVPASETAETHRRRNKRKAVILSS